MIEPIESRQLMSSVTYTLTATPLPTPTATATLDNAGTLTVVGTSGAEKIALTESGPTTSGGAAKIDVIVSTRTATAKFVATAGSFDVKQVKSIEVRAGNGKDSVNIHLTHDVPTLVDGGQGNDDLRTNRGQTTLRGGAGDDSLYSLGTPNYRLVTDDRHRRGAVLTVNGSGVVLINSASLSGAERDAVPAAYLATYRAGQATFDITRVAVPTTGIFFSSATDSLKLRAVLDATYNQLDGGDGDDTLYSRGGEDTLEGGAGTDAFVSLNAGVEGHFAPLASNLNVVAKETTSRVALLDIELTKDQGEAAASLIGPPAIVSVRTASLHG